MTDSKINPFPFMRPDITINRIEGRTFTVDCQELRWWFGIPRKGDHTLWSTYDYNSSGWTLSSVIEMEATSYAEIHDIEGVEIGVNEWEPEGGWKLGTWNMYGRLTTDSVQWLAVSRMRSGKRILRTFLDEGFDREWGECPRCLKDEGRFLLQEDGSYQQSTQWPNSVGAGIFSVSIGEKVFTCLRGLDPGDEISEANILVEAYLTESGRTLLFRRYNGRLWGLGNGHYKEPWDERFPKNHRIVIDGVVYVHWYDSLSHIALE
jgi:hypothetical protein